MVCQGPRSSKWQSWGLHQGHVTLHAHTYIPHPSKGCHEAQAPFSKPSSILSLALSRSFLLWVISHETPRGGDALAGGFVPSVLFSTRPSHSKIISVIGLIATSVPPLQPRKPTSLSPFPSGRVCEVGFRFEFFYCPLPVPFKELFRFKWLW